MTKKRNRRSIPIEVRFWPKVNKNGPIPEYAPHLGPCWIWLAAKSSGGYGQIGLNGKIVYAHRVSYEMVHGPLPGGTTHHIDHLCRVPACVNPAHLEWVTASDNSRRGLTGPTSRARAAAQTHCKNGHEFTEANTYLYARDGYTHRMCRMCALERYYTRQQAKGAKVYRRRREVADASPVADQGLASQGRRSAGLRGS